jgi:hypothetical protein
VAAIRRFLWPNTIKELQAFLGLVNFYRRFVRSAAKLLAATDSGTDWRACGQHQVAVVGHHGSHIYSGEGSRRSGVRAATPGWT